MADFILSIDQGTTGSTVSLVDAEGAFRIRRDKDFRQIYPQPGWVEHDPRDIWDSVESSLQAALQAGQIKTSDIRGIGITNQRETVLVWNRRTGEPLYNAIVWQCRRTTEFCNRLKRNKILAQKVRKKTGLVLDPYFSGSKIRWILDHVKGARAMAAKGELACGTMDTYILWRLTGGRVHATDVSNASRTLLMNIHTGDWDPELLKIFDVPRELLPEIRSSSEVYGVTEAVAGLPSGIPIAGIAGDQQAALFGQAGFDVGDAKITYGTGSFLLLNTGTQAKVSKAGVLTTVAWKLGPKAKTIYALEGSAFICGAAVQWLRDEMKFISAASDVERLAQEVPDSGGVEFVPAFAGLGAPYWDPEARGLICGLTRGSNRAHLARATLEGIALQNVDLLLAMQKDIGKKMKGVRVDGGACENNLLMQIQSDYLGAQLFRPQNIETTSMGAAYLAGLGVGVWKNLEAIRKVWKLDRSFIPQIKKKAQQDRLTRWARAVARARSAK